LALTRAEKRKAVRTTYLSWQLRDFENCFAVFASKTGILTFVSKKLFATFIKSLHSGMPYTKHGHTQPFQMEVFGAAMC